MKKAVTVALALLLTGVLFQIARAGDTLEDVRKKGVLVVGVRDAFPPFGFRDAATGEIVGIDVDLVRAIADKMKVKLSLKPVTAAERMPALVDGTVDIVAAAMISTPDRAKLADFSISYFKTIQRVLARPGAISRLEDLAGKKIGVVRGSLWERNVRAVVPSAAITPFSDMRSAVAALEKGEVDAVSANSGVLYSVLATLPKGAYEIPNSVKIAEEGYRLAVRKGNPKFLEFVNVTLVELDRIGEAKNVFNKWFQRKEEGVAMPGVPEAMRAVGVITRPAGAQGRFVALGIKGSFWPDADVSMFDPQGKLVGRGKIKDIYEDEVYVDVVDKPHGVIQAGFVVSMNYTDQEAKKPIISLKDVIKNVNVEEKREEAQRGKEIAAEYKKENVARELHQDDMAKSKMLLDYQYSDDYYWHRYPW